MEKPGDMIDINKIPKLYLRPKSADGNCHRGSQTTPDMNDHRETYSRSALGSYENDRISKVNYVISEIP